MNKKNLIIGALLLAVVGFTSVWYFVFYRPTHHVRDIAGENAIVVSAKDIVKEFQTNESQANTKYLNKKSKLSRFTIHKLSFLNLNHNYKIYEK